MSAHQNLRSCSPLKTVLDKLVDSYHAYYNTYKTHTMATHHGGVGKPLDMDANLNGTDASVNIQDNYHNFESLEQENVTNLPNLTWELDDIHHRVQASEGQSAEGLHCIDKEL